MLSRQKRLSQSPEVDCNFINRPISQVCYKLDENGDSVSEVSEVSPSDFNRSLRCQDFSLSAQVLNGVKLNPVSVTSQRLGDVDRFEKSLSDNMPKIAESLKKEKDK